MLGGTLEKVTMADVIKDIVQRHPTAPPSSKSTIDRAEWLEAVQANDSDITRLVLARTVSMVKTVDTIEEKLKILPDMQYLIDCCLEWMQS